MRRIPDSERRARLGRHHGFTTDSDDLAATAHTLVGVHSTDPVSVFLAGAARGAVDSVEGVERTLYEDRTCLRMLGMRRTLFVVPLVNIAAVQRGYTDSFVARERKRFARWLARTDVADDGVSHIDRMTNIVLKLLSDLGEASTRELTSANPELDRRFTPPVGGQTGTLSVGSRVVLLMTAAGLLARTRPLGTWISSQYRYAPMKSWIGHPIPEMEPSDARAHLAQGWLEAYGPGSVTDLQWWTGWNLGQTRAALTAINAVEVELDTGPGWVSAEDTEPVTTTEPWAALLPGLDSTPMGWKERDWYLGPHRDRLFDRNGNVGPTVWWNGRIVGGWAQRPDGKIVTEYLEDVSDECRRLVDAERERLAGFLGDTRFTPRFRTPLERELAAF
ncbi:MAG: winged helix DNA-binding domain-containing protein [Acidimicrobiia bacterium]